MMYVIDIICQNGHTQQLKLSQDLGRVWAENYAALLDGSSPLYLYPPDETSSLGKCGLCGKRIKATVMEEQPT